MIIYPIDDVYDLAVGHICRDYATNKIIGKIERISSGHIDPNIIYPTVRVDDEYYLRNGFEFYDCHKINQYMIRPPTEPWWPRIKL